MIEPDTEIGIVLLFYIYDSHRNLIRLSYRNICYIFSAESRTDIRASAYAATDTDDIEIVDRRIDAVDLAG